MKIHKKILVITQAVDQNDTVLGFFVGWLREFAARAESVEVICQRTATPATSDVSSTLPKNITVYSLGKEKGMSKLRQAMRFYRLTIAHRSSYDSVFVHMNQEYILLGGLLWKIFGKEIMLWRNHPRGNWLTRIAVAFSNKVFYTSSQSFTAQFAKAQRMPAGIDLNLFAAKSEQAVEQSITRKKNSILVFGRISPIKRVEMVIEACTLLKNSGHDIELSIIGDVLPKDNGYLQHMREIAEKAGEWIHFDRGVPFAQAPDIYRRHEIFVNCTESGSFDKTVIEALASGMKVVTTNESMKDILPEGSYAENTAEAVAKAIEKLLTLGRFDASGASAEQLYAEKAAACAQKQSLTALMDQLFI